jgi:endogenous inhibitor of DNA gyrase (YacG/DUF329 family)
MTSPARRCPHCKRPTAPRLENPAAPFCSDRCKLIDLDRWLLGEYVVSTPLAGDVPDHPEGEEPA